MKKILSVALLTLAVVALANNRASAGMFFHCKNCVTFCAAYPNAFSPPCLGIKTCCGCCMPLPSLPFPQPAPCEMPCEMPAPDCCADGACPGQLPAPGPGEAAPAPAGAPSSDFPPTPTPVPQNPESSQKVTPVPQGPSRAAYQQPRAAYQQPQAAYQQPQAASQQPQAAYYYGHSLSVLPTTGPAVYSHGMYPGYNYGQGAGYGQVYGYPMAVPSYWNGGR